jgi:hypothetical protein
MADQQMQLLLLVSPTRRVSIPISRSIYGCRGQRRLPFAGLKRANACDAVGHVQLNGAVNLIVEGHGLSLNGPLQCNSSSSLCFVFRGAQQTKQGRGEGDMGEIRRIAPDVAADTVLSVDRRGACIWQQTTRHLSSTNDVL